MGLKNPLVKQIVRAMLNITSKKSYANKINSTNGWGTYRST